MFFGTPLPSKYKVPKSAVPNKSPSLLAVRKDGRLFYLVDGFVLLAPLAHRGLI